MSHESQPQVPPADPARYPRSTTLQTRWRDNDIYGHVNNATYYEYMDTAINTLLISEGGLDIHTGSVIGICAESHCKFLGPLTFPGTVEVSLRVGHLGNSSVRYELALFDGDTGKAAATGWFVHVFVGDHDRAPAAIPPKLRSLLETLTGPHGDTP